MAPPIPIPHFPRSRSAGALFSGTAIRGKAGRVFPPLSAAGHLSDATPAGAVMAIRSGATGRRDGHLFPSPPRASGGVSAAAVRKDVRPRRRAATEVARRATARPLEIGRDAGWKRCVSTGAEGPRRSNHDSHGPTSKHGLLQTSRYLKPGPQRNSFISAHHREPAAQTPISFGLLACDVHSDLSLILRRGEQHHHEGAGVCLRNKTREPFAENRT